MSTKRSRVHPNYKTKYRVSNWPSYEASLVQRGNINIWMSPDAIENWNAKPARRRKRGGQPKYSDLAIETALTLRLLLNLPLRQTEGFLGSIFELMGLQLDAPDYHAVPALRAIEHRASSPQDRWLDRHVRSRWIGFSGGTAPEEVTLRITPSPNHGKSPGSPEFRAPTERFCVNSPGRPSLAIPTEHHAPPACSGAEPQIPPRT